MTEDLPLDARGTRVSIRAQMWRDALADHDTGRARAKVRGSDYVGPGAESHLGGRVTPRLLAGKDVTAMKSADTPHTWTATQDVARLLVIAARDDKAWGRPWHVPSNPPRTQREGVGDLCRVAGVSPVKVKEYPSLLIRGMGLFNSVMRDLPEVAYQFEEPFILDFTAAQTTFDLAPTPWDDMLAGTIDKYTD